MSNVTFSHLLNIYRNLVFDQNAKGGTLTLSSESLRDTLAFLLAEESLDDSGVSLSSGNPDQLVVGQTVHLQITEPRLGLGVLANNLDGLLKTRKARIEERKNYFLIDSMYARGDQNVPVEVQRYKNLLGFIQLLKEAAAYLESEREELIFIHDGKFTLPLNYCTSDILSSDFSAMKILEDSFVNDTHKEQKLAILADTVVSLVKGAPPAERFKRLLSHLPELQRKFADGYRLFVSNFSYDKVRNELEAAKIEYTGKIHKVFSDIQNQMLSIPVATIIVATQMKDASAKTATSYEVWVNSAVLLGCWIFVLLVGFLIANQRHTLQVLVGEITRQKDLLRRNHQTVAPAFDDIFVALDKRLRLQNLILWAISIVLAVGFVLAHAVYFSLTPIALGLLKNIASFIVQSVC